MLKVDRIIVSSYETNCYMIMLNQDVIIVDPGDDFKLIKDYIQKYNLTPIGYLITHDHPDHVGALADLIKEYKISSFANNDKIKFKTILTPGHTDDGKCFYFEDEQVIFTGDTLFKETIGRMDLGGNHRDMFKSLKILKSLRDDVIVYPGHGPETTIGFEKQNNIWLK